MKMKQLFGGEPRLESDSLILRRIEDSDLEDLFQLYSNEKIYQYRPGVVRKTVETVEKLVENCRREYADKEAVYLAICPAGNLGKVIGVGEIFGIDARLEMVNVGYSICEEYWHRGVATKAVGMMVDYLFEVVEVNRIQAQAMPENIPSAHVLLKNGLRHEGLIRQGALWSGKGLVDFNQYAILREDWLVGSCKSVKK